MKITVLTQNFAPEMGATATRLYELTTRLAARGHAVTVITAMPNYPVGRVFDEYRGKLRLEEEMDGVRVVRTWVRPSESARPFPGFLPTCRSWRRACSSVGEDWGGSTLCCSTARRSSLSRQVWPLGVSRVAA